MAHSYCVMCSGRATGKAKLSWTLKNGKTQIGRKVRDLSVRENGKRKHGACMSMTSLRDEREICF